MKKILLLLFIFHFSFLTMSAQLTVADITTNNRFLTARVNISKILAEAEQETKQQEDTVGSGSVAAPYTLRAKNSKPIYRRSFTAEYTVKETATGKEIKIPGEIQVPTLSPDNKHVAYVRDNNLYLLDLSKAFNDLKAPNVLKDPNALKEIPITTDGAHGKIINGHADWVYEEEFGQTVMYAFTADGSALAWVRFDETDVKEMQLQFHNGGSYPDIYSFKYPKAGEDNSKVTLCTYVLANQETYEKELRTKPDDYIPVVRTIPGDNGNILVCTLNRHQDEMKLWKISCFATRTDLLAKLSSKCYLPEEAVTDLTLYPDGFIVLNDNDGTMQPFLYDYNGKLVRPLIADKSIIVTEFYGYDFRTQTSYFQAVGDTPMQRVIYKADKKGRLKKLSFEDGWNTATFNDDFTRYVLTHSNINTPPAYYLCTVGADLMSARKNKGNVPKLIEDNAKLKETLAKETLPSREFFKFTTTEGVELNGVIYKPADFDPTKKYPVIFHQYSGPGSQQVTDNWTIGSVARGGMFEAILCQHGYICVSVDPRGTAARGADFQKLTYMKMGQMESRDQVEAALYMATQPWVDPDRLAIWGWSYGGFNTLMSMSFDFVGADLVSARKDGQGIFRCGVSIAPPTDWRFYDTVYTERYMRTPQENPEGYGDNPIARAKNLQGNLLLCHGLCDDNVHPQNTFEYTPQLVEQGKQFDLHIFTNSNHSIYNGNSRRFLLEKVLAFFDENLK